MKLKIFIFFLCICATSLYSQKTFIPDDNFEQKLINLGFDSGPLDNYINTQSIDTITDIFLIGLNINNLTGIEDFKSLKYLQLKDNKLTNLDVSKLKDLRVLDFTLNNIEAINVSNNSNLEFIFCNNNPIKNLQLQNNSKISRIEIDNTNISSINLKYNKLLTIFSCNNTPLKFLDLTENKLMERFFCNNTSVEEVNFKNDNNFLIKNFSCLNNPSLTCFLVDDKNYSQTNWSNINDSSLFTDTVCKRLGYTYVPDDNFEQALINLTYDTGDLDDYVLTDNIKNIKELNINQLDIADLTGIEDFIALKNLEVNNNNLSSLNVATNINLISLSSSKNLISDINLTNNLNLETLLINNNNITDLNILNNSNLTTINCSNNPLNSFKLPVNSNVDDLYIQSTLISELDLRNQNRLISTSTSFLEIQNNTNLTCVYVDDVNKYTVDTFNVIIKDSSTTFVENEAACISQSCTILVDNLSDIVAFNTYTLPKLTNGKYYTENKGKGSQLFEGEIINNSQIIYIYNENRLDASCNSESSFLITINNCLIPTFFTPNNDFKNDYWAVNCNSIKVNAIYIFNRFGQLIKTIQPNTEGWNGNYNNKKAPANTYWYLIKFENGTSKRGFFSLIR